MEITSINMGKDREDEDNTVQHENFLLSKQDTPVSKRCRRKLGQGTTLMLNIRRSRVRLSCWELYLLNIHGLPNTIPKHITTVEEKYALRCLELIHKCALRAAARNFNTKVDVLLDMSNLAEINSLSSNSMTSLAIGCPLVVGSDEALNTTGDWTIGTVSGSQSMINILKSPLLRKFSSFDGAINFGRTDLLDEDAPFCSDILDYPQISTKSFSGDLQKNVNILDRTCASQFMHKKDISISSTNSSSSDESLSPAYTPSFQGMLQCSWKDRLPNHIFTVDDKREVYVASLSPAESSGCKALDYVYTFHSRRNAKKECNHRELELESVAKMQVSTSITLSSSNSEVRETQFVLSVSSNSRAGEKQTSDNALRKNRRLTRKVVDAFRAGHSTKQRSISRSSAIFEDSSWDPSDDVHYHHLHPNDGCVEDKDAPNFEMAAIVVKHIYNNRKKTERGGGWGLKFLKRYENNASQETAPASTCSLNTEECMTSVNIIIPAGVHGGPRTRVGGPSSLTERWISGGHCDCGGWDIGCPLQILNARSNITDHSFSHFGEIKSVDIFLQGSNQHVPIMKMVNVHEGLYYIHFQATLSTLQSFAIAAAIIHSQSPVLRPKVFRS